VTNQPAVGRGLATKNQVDFLNSEMVSDIITNGGQSPVILTCMHGWTDNCECRKPNVGLFIALQEMYDINWKNAIYIGDDARDREVAVTLNLAFIPATNAYTKISQDIKLILEKRLNPSH
jgi:D-glycero-D-manno-heptose 1,7-bisphosphate phosphatase